MPIGTPLEKFDSPVDPAVDSWVAVATREFGSAVEECMGLAFSREHFIEPGPFLVVLARGMAVALAAAGQVYATDRRDTEFKLLALAFLDAFDAEAVARDVDLRMSKTINRLRKEIENAAPAG